MDWADEEAQKWMDEMFDDSWIKHPLFAEKLAELLRKVSEAKDTRAILANDPTPVGAAMRRVESGLPALAAVKGE